MKQIESEQWKLMAEAVNKKYGVAYTDKIRDGRSFIEKLTISGALGVTVEGLYDIVKYGDKYPGSYNGKQFSQTPMMIQGKKFKVYANY